MLIGITGQKGSGKDTFAKALIEMGFANVKMADPLKQMLRTLYLLAGEKPAVMERKIEGDLKEEPCHILRGATPRWAMQSLGTEWAKMIDPDHLLWSSIFRERATDLLRNGTPVVCTDVRFMHEVKVVNQLGGHMVRIVRPSSEAQRDLHPSEREMEGLPVDVTFYNTTTIEALEDQARDFLKGLTS